MNISYINIKKFATNILICVSVSCIAILNACTDDIDMPDNGDCPVGMPAELTLSLDLSDMAVISRGELADGLDNKITSLWVAAYRATGSMELIGSTTVNETSEKNFHENFGSVTFNLESGPTYIVAVANYDHSMASKSNGGEIISLYDALAAADTWDKFRDIAVFFDSQGNSFIDAPANLLVMNGFYTEPNHTSGDRPALTLLNVDPGQNKPSGKIHLRRIISQVKFNITYDDKNVKSCDISSWQVYNLPTNSWLHERTDDTTEKPLNSFDIRHVADRPGYSNSIRRSDITESNGVYSFDYWQLENKRTGNDNATDYKSREKEHKNTDGSNSGKYVSLVDGIDSSDANNNATYVVFHAIMEMNVDQDGKPLGTTTRIVETDYVVHLGYIDDNPKDFNCHRNSKYTYKVKIKNVNDLYVEASKKDEQAPGVEGSISDITDVYYELDAHYAAINVELTDINLEDFNYYISATRLDGTEIIIDSRDELTVPSTDSKDYKYLTWVEFRKTDDANTLATYKPHSYNGNDGKTYTLDEIKALCGSKKFETGHYTMFINEYVYEDASSAKNGNESESTNWKNYVNKRPRRMWLIVKSATSPDKESTYFESKYAVSQKSIQCYYNVNDPKLTSALGIEHENESFGLALRNDFNHFVINVDDKTYVDTKNSPGRNNIAGRYNIAQFIAKSESTGLSWNDDSYKWSDYLDLNDFQFVPAINKQGVDIDARTEQLPKIKTGSITEVCDYNLSPYEPSTSIIQAITACLNRNRDLDGDGNIDAGELRWFVPTSSQSLRIILGRQSLEDPLLDPKGIDELSDKNKNGFNTRMMFYTSDGKNLWAMEGTSLSQHRQWPKEMSSPWEVRCVRNLGSDMTKINDKAANTPAFKKVEGKNIVDLSLFDENSLRQEPYHGPIPIHHINDQRYNRCYKAFEFKDEVILLNGKEITENNLTFNSGDSWSSYLTRVNPCDVYNKNGETGWRVPNQKEAAIIGILNEHKSNTNGSSFQKTCSFSYFDKSGYSPGNNPYDPNGTITSEYRYEMTLRSEDGGCTQQNNTTLSSAGNGVRCVRDYTGAL